MRITHLSFDLPLVSVTVPAGKERVTPNQRTIFESMSPQRGGKPAFSLLFLFDRPRRVDARPFVIDASGVTHWIDLPDTPMPPGRRWIRFRRIVFRGAAPARDTPDQFEARITKINRHNDGGPSLARALKSK